MKLQNSTDSSKEKILQFINSTNLREVQFETKKRNYIFRYNEYLNRPSFFSVLFNGKVLYTIDIYTSCTYIVHNSVCTKIRTSNVINEDTRFQLYLQYSTEPKVIDCLDFLTNIMRQYDNLPNC